MLPLFLATCSIVIGLGMVVPLLPFYAVAYGASAWDVVMLFAIYSGCQFLAAPLGISGLRAIRWPTAGADMRAIP